MNKKLNWQHCTECGDYIDEVQDDVYYCEKCDYAFTEHQLFEFWKKQDEHDDFDRMRDLEL
jgi:hypothetical protein